ncbi:MAG: hypothetical protein EXR75_16575 [Myxococcales bacterium]|nr:hypothetical protein [Myxococcales bacterium]
MTTDTCDALTGIAAHEPEEIGKSCDDDGALCTGIGICTENAICAIGAAPAVDDGDDCTRDGCDPTTGLVTHTPLSGCVNPLWEPLATALAPSPRTLHTAVWTGTRMLIWGGSTAAGATDSGASYDPVTDAWKAISTFGAPSPRHSHIAVWTGVEMIVWGGFGDGAFPANGARYNPATDSWSALPATNLGGRVGHAGAWSGSEFIVWGGRGGAVGATSLSTGARYNPTTNVWATMASGGPTARFDAGHAFTGAQHCIWGGSDTFDWLSNGKCYAPATDTWTTMAGSGAPTTREDASAVWTGSVMLVWGGWAGGPYRNDGAGFDPNTGASGEWTPMAGRGAPSERASNVAAWTGSELIVWGGCAGEVVCEVIREDGARYDVNADSWQPIAADTTFAGRHDTAWIWSGTSLIVFSGARGSELIAGGGKLTF